MVQQGSFSLQLINAESTKPFQEHYCHRDGLYYAEVEPNAEYWIRVQVLERRRRNDSYEDDNDSDDDDEDDEYEYHGSSSLFAGQVFECHVHVDGKDLGYSTYMSRKEQHDLGIWSRTRDGVDINQALKVQEIKGTKHENGGEDLLPYWVGCIQVDMYEAHSSYQYCHSNNYYNGKTTTTTTTTSKSKGSNDKSKNNKYKNKSPARGVMKSRWKRGKDPKVACANTNDMAKKIVKSIPGTTTTTTNTNRNNSVPSTISTTMASSSSSTIPATTLTSTTKAIRTDRDESSCAITKTYRKGSLLETITLHYCTARGLVHVGVLPPPPPPPTTASTATERCKRLLVHSHRQIKPNVIKEQTYMNGIVICEKSIDLFDLTNMDEDNDDDDPDETKQPKMENAQEQQEDKKPSLVNVSTLIPDIVTSVASTVKQRQRTCTKRKPQYCHDNDEDDDEEDVDGNDRGDAEYHDDGL